jgi:hypothetical protein
MRTNWQVKTALGAALTTAGTLAIVLSLILGCYGEPSLWVAPLEFTAGVAAEIVAARTVGGLIERRRLR